MTIHKQFVDNFRSYGGNCKLWPALLLNQNGLSGSCSLAFYQQLALSLNQTQVRVNDMCFNLWTRCLKRLGTGHCQYFHIIIQIQFTVILYRYVVTSLVWKSKEEDSGITKFNYHSNTRSQYAGTWIKLFFASFEGFLFNDKI